MDYAANNHIGDTQPKDEATGKGPQTPIANRTISDSTPPPQHSRERETCRPDQTPLGKIILEVAAFIVGSFAVIIYGGQLWVMSGTLDEQKRSGEQNTQQMWSAINNINWMARSMDWSQKQSQQSLDATIDNFHRDQRAWVGIESTSISQAEKGKPVIVDLVLKNSGKTPATHVYKPTVLDTVLQAQDGPSRNRIDFLKRTVLRYPGSSIPPNGTYTMRLGESPSVIGTFEELQSSKLVFYFEGIVQYSDAFGKVHHTQWCIFIRDLTAKELQFCKSFHDMD